MLKYYTSIFFAVPWFYIHKYIYIYTTLRDLMLGEHIPIMKENDMRMLKC